MPRQAKTKCVSSLPACAAIGGSNGFDSRPSFPVFQREANKIDRSALADDADHNGRS
jgi:hypothetical protein